MIYFKSENQNRKVINSSIALKLKIKTPNISISILSL